LGLARLSLLVGVGGADAPVAAGAHPRPVPSRRRRVPHSAGCAPPLPAIRVSRAIPAIRGQSCRWGDGGPPARAKPRVGEGGRDGTPLAPGCANTPPARTDARAQPQSA